MQNRQTNRFFIICALILVLVGSMLGCGKAETTEEAVVLTYINTQKTKLVEEKTYLSEEKTLAQIDEVLTLLATPSSKLAYYAPLSQEISVISRSYINGFLTVNFSENYKDLDAATEILIRASVVKSLTQIEGVEKVAFCVKGEPLKDKLNKEVGVMTASLFIDS